MKMLKKSYFFKHVEKFVIFNNLNILTKLLFMLVENC